MSSQPKTKSQGYSFFGGKSAAKSKSAAPKPSAERVVVKGQKRSSTSALRVASTSSPRVNSSASKASVHPFSDLITIYGIVTYAIRMRISPLFTGKTKLGQNTPSTLLEASRVFPEKVGKTVARGKDLAIFAVSAPYVFFRFTYVFGKVGKSGSKAGFYRDERSRTFFSHFSPRFPHFF